MLDTIKDGLNLNKKKSSKIFFIIVLISIIILILIPTGFEPVLQSNSADSTRTRGLILEVDNSKIKQVSMIKVGGQTLKIRILDGKFKGQEIIGVNNLVGKLEIDKMFIEGDVALVVINYRDNNIISSNVIDHYRINYEIILMVIFCLILIIFAGWTGVNAILSFIFTGLYIWKILLPFFLKGFNPIITSLISVSILSGVIIFLVAGLNKKGFAAFLGAISGVVLTCILSIVFEKGFKVHGAIKPFAEALLYTGFGNIDLGGIFLSGIFIASSGAIMDIAMDISASMHEISLKKPDITVKELMKSGFAIGRSVIGTMTTTLLLAYSGGYTAMLMLFLAQGVPIVNMLNLNYVAGEILHTLVGSFGLVTVSPITAIIGSFILTMKKHKTISHKEE